jgi:hypothetical protein
VTEVYLAGAENPSHQEILRSCGADKVAVNVTSLLRRKTLSWTLDLETPGWEWVAYCDGPASADDLRVVLDQAAKAPLWVVGPPAWSEWDTYLPLWNGEGEMPLEGSRGIVVTDRVFKDKNLRRRTLGSRTSGSQLGAITGSTDAAIGKFDLVLSGAWWSSMKYGETQVWDGRAMHRYNANNQGEVRTRHADHIASLGMDTDLVLAGDPDESCRLAIASWLAYAASLQGGTVLHLPARSEASSDFLYDNEKRGSDMGTLDTTPRTGRHRKVLLPVMGTGLVTSTEKAADGTDIIEEQAIVQSVNESVRSCNNCYLAQSGCPGYEPDASCAYSIPVEIRSKDQLQAVLQAVIELQTQRVFQARFAEELQGQEMTPEVGQEMDRLFRSVEKMRDIMDNREMVKMTVEARGKSGVLSRLFGTQVGTNAKMLTEPVDSTDVIDAVLEED